MKRPSFLPSGNSIICSFSLYDAVQQRFRTLGIKPSFMKKVHTSPIWLTCLREEVCQAEVVVKQRFEFMSRCYANCPGLLLGVPFFEPLYDAINQSSAASHPRSRS